MLKAQMNPDLFTDDLRKKRSSNQKFWLVGQPDVKIHKLKDSMIQVEVMGFDYYNPKTGNVQAAGKKISPCGCWIIWIMISDRFSHPRCFFTAKGGMDPAGKKFEGRD